jgi:hypothetical protein
MTERADRLFGELDRQLDDVRTACDGVATRAGLLLTLAGVAGAILATRLSTITAWSLAAISAILVSGYFAAWAIVPGLVEGPNEDDLDEWRYQEGASVAIDALWTAKVAVATANKSRLRIMQLFLRLETAAAVAAAILTFVAIARG